MTPSGSNAVVSAVQALQWTLLCSDAALVLLLMVTSGDILRRLGPEPGALIPLEGLALRSRVPALDLFDRRSGDWIHTSVRGRRQLFAFLSFRCRPCRELIPHLNRVAAEHRDVRIVAIVSAGDHSDALMQLVPSVAVVEDDERRTIATHFEARYEPFIYVTDTDARVTFRAVTNSLLELQDALGGFGHRQMTAWTPIMKDSDPA